MRYCQQQNLKKIIYILTKGCYNAWQIEQSNHTMSSKEIRIRKQEQTGAERSTDIQICNRDKNSPVETCDTYHVQLSMEEYGQLTRRALQEGCSPEELVARAVAKLVQE